MGPKRRLGQKLFSVGRRNIFAGAPRPAEDNARSNKPKLADVPRALRATITQLAASGVLGRHINVAPGPLCEEYTHFHLGTLPAARADDVPHYLRRWYPCWTDRNYFGGDF